MKETDSNKLIDELKEIIGKYEEVTGLRLLEEGKNFKLNFVLFKKLNAELLLSKKGKMAKITLERIYSSEEVEDDLYDKVQFLTAGTKLKFTMYQDGDFVVKMHQIIGLSEELSYEDAKGQVSSLVDDTIEKLSKKADKIGEDLDVADKDGGKDITAGCPSLINKENKVDDVNTESVSLLKINEAEVRNNGEREIKTLDPTVEAIDNADSKDTIDKVDAADNCDKDREDVMLESRETHSNPKGTGTGFQSEQPQKEEKPQISNNPIIASEMNAMYEEMNRVFRQRKEQADYREETLDKLEKLLDQRDSQIKEKAKELEERESIVNTKEQTLKFNQTAFAEEKAAFEREREEFRRLKELEEKIKA